MNTMSIKKSFFILGLTFVLVQPLFAQQTRIYTDPDKLYHLGLELYDKEKYGAAREQFEKALRMVDEQNLKGKEGYNLIAINSEYYAARCALELFNQDAEDKLLHFVNTYPESPFSKTANFQIGKFYYQQRKYDYALRWLLKSDISNLTAEERVEYQFKTAFSYFSLDSLSQASEGFQKVKKLQSKYAYPATYYYAYIAYRQKDYDTALENFIALKDSKTYSEIVPYYVVSIYYEKAQYRELLSYAKDYKDNPKVKNQQDILKLSASAAFKLDDYPAAIALYEDLLKKNPTLSSAQVFELGYACHQTEKYDQAITWLKKISEENNIYAQNGLFTLGDCFLKKGDKQAARNAFWKASKLSFDANTTRESLFLYAKLSFELQFHQLAIDGFQNYIKTYPKEENTEEAKYLLGEALISTKNYKDAIDVLESIGTKKTGTALAYQKVCYYRGVEVFNEKDMNGAIALFDKSLANVPDKSIQSQAYFWKAEALYNKNDFENAAKNFLLSVNNPSLTALPTFNQANYNLGYCYFRMEDYKSAVYYFDRYLKAEKQNQKCINDATLRLADGYFVIKTYDKALFNYNKIINEKQSGADYALFQKGMILGLQNKLNDKVVTMQTLLSTYPKSSYADDAYYETGSAQFVMNNISDAIANFMQLINNFKGSRYVSKAKLSLGLIYYNQSDDQRSLSMYKSVITDYPGSDEAKEALLAIKNIYVDAGNADEYLAFVKTLPFASVTEGAQDSITYQAANNRYLLGDCDNAITGLTSYIDKFPSGYFITESHYHRAECYLRKKNEEKALVDYTYLIDKNKTAYLERALLMAARISYNQKKYEDAAQHYTRLESVAEFKENFGEAISGAMKSYMALNDCEDAMKYANKVILFEKASSEDINMAHLYLGKCYLAANNPESALSEFNIVTKNTTTETGAEAKYLTALILFNKGEYIQSQKTCFELSNQIPSYDYWIAKAFILLADNYLKLGNEFQARSTLQSILDEYEGNDDIRTTAQQKLESLSLPK